MRATLYGYDGSGIAFFIDERNDKAFHDSREELNSLLSDKSIFQPIGIFERSRSNFRI